MSGKVVNLRRARKARDRATARSAADVNAARHGESGGVKSLREAEAARAARTLDGARREGSDASADDDDGV